MDKIGLLVLKVISKGCTSCVGTIKNHLYRAKGVLGIHIRSKDVIVLYNPIINPQNIIEESSINTFYRVVIKENKLIDRETIHKIIKPIRKYVIR